MGILRSEGLGLTHTALGKHELPARAPPVPPPFAAALFGAALQNNEMRLCVLLQVGFRAFLRTCEMLLLATPSPDL